MPDTDVVMFVGIRKDHRQQALLHLRMGNSRPLRDSGKFRPRLLDRDSRRAAEPNM